METGFIDSLSRPMWTQMHHLGLFANDHQWSLIYFVCSIVSVCLSTPVSFSKWFDLRLWLHTQRNLTDAS